MENKYLLNNNIIKLSVQNNSLLKRALQNLCPVNEQDLS